jgi:protein TonB
MSTAAAINPVDRLGLTLFFAISFHMVVVFGISFTLEKPAKTPPPDRTLSITVIQNPKPKPEEKPKETDYLAQVTQQGGGQVEEKVLPKTQVAPPAPQKAPAPKKAEPPSPPPAPVKKAVPKKVLTQKEPAKKKIQVAPKAPKETPKRKLTARQLLASTNMEIERLSAELDRKTKAYAKRPRRKSINASTQEYKYANYLDAWRRKVERVGNLNYPDEAKRRKMYGKLILHVAVRSDGTVQKIRVLESSGYKLLDDAAVRIVRLSAPFSAFPSEISEETDILDITRTWQFLHNNKLFSK